MTILLNIQTNDVDAAAEVTRAHPDRIVIGVTAKEFPCLDDGIAVVKAMQEQGARVSVGLGGGSADQWPRALEMARATHPFHLNQVFPAAGLSKQVLSDLGATTLVNGLVRPADAVGAVCLGTGPVSRRHGDEAVSVELAADLLQEVGVTSVKLFPLNGLAMLEHLQAMATAVAERGMTIEPTGGVTPENIGPVLDACLEAGACRVMPHLYSSVKDPVTGELDLRLVDSAMAVIDGREGARS